MVKKMKNNLKIQIAIYERLNLMYNINIIKVKEYLIKILIN